MFSKFTKAKTTHDNVHFYPIDNEGFTRSFANCEGVLCGAGFELPAEASGIITLKAAEGDAVKVGAVVCLIDTSAERPAGLVSKPIEAAKKEVTVATPVPNPLPVEKTAVVAEKPASYAAGHPSIAAKKVMDGRS